jgi:hypothetical protein
VRLLSAYAASNGQQTLPNEQRRRQLSGCMHQTAACAASALRTAPLAAHLMPAAPVLPAGRQRRRLRPTAACLLHTPAGQQRRLCCWGRGLPPLQPRPRAQAWCSAGPRPRHP